MFSDQTYFTQTCRPCFSTNKPVEKTNIPVPVVDVSGVRPLLHNPSWIPLSPLGHHRLLEMEYFVVNEQKSDEVCSGVGAYTIFLELVRPFARK